jgi:hypothetical protein
MLFPRNPLASGPQAYFYPGKRIEKVKAGKGLAGRLLGLKRGPLERDLCLEFTVPESYIQ